MTVTLPPKTKAEFEMWASVNDNYLPFYLLSKEGFGAVDIEALPFDFQSGAYEVYFTSVSIECRVENPYLEYINLEEAKITAINEAGKIREQQLTEKDNVS